MSTQQSKVFVARSDNSPATIGPQGQNLVACVNNSICGAQRISAGMVFMPPSAMSRVHYHADSEIIVVCTRGWAATVVGPELDVHIHGPGEFLYVPSGVLHCAINLSTADELTAIEMRTDPSFNDDVVVVPELQDEANRLAAELRDEFSRSVHSTLAASV